MTDLKITWSIGGPYVNNAASYSCPISMDEGTAGILFDIIGPPQSEADA